MNYAYNNGKGGLISMSFQIEYNGHGKNARKAIIKLGLVTEKELALMI